MAPNIQSTRSFLTQSKTRYLASGPSFALDILRLLAALTVAVGHLSEPRFTTGWPPSLINLSVAAVAVFFVLSGFVIRCITSARPTDGRRYATDRFARIYSVALPRPGAHRSLRYGLGSRQSAWYSAQFVAAIAPAGPHATIIHTLSSQTWLRDSIRILLSLTMLSQSWFQDISPLSNSPFWSLSYECVYYALFGITLYLRGSKRALGWILVFLLTGPTVFLMFPLWLLGCAAWDAYDDGFQPRSIGKLVACSLLSIAGVHGSHAVVEILHLSWFRLKPRDRSHGFHSHRHRCDAAPSLRRASRSPHSGSRAKSSAPSGAWEMQPSPSISSTSRSLFCSPQPFLTHTQASRPDS